MHAARAHPVAERDVRLRLFALQLVRVVRAEEGDLVAVAPGQLPQPLLVRLAGPVVGGVEVLEEAQARRAGWRRLDLAVVEVGVAAVQQPALRRSDRDAGVAERVTVERYQRDLGAGGGEDAHAREAEPLVAAGVVSDPARRVFPVGADVARPVAQPRLQRRVELGREDVHLGRGEVGQAAAVIGVEVGGDDMTDVGGGEAERLDLLQRRRLRPRLGVHQPEDGAELARVAGVLHAEAGVDQDQALAALDQQAVADHLGGREHAAFAPKQAPPVGAQRPAAEVMDRHPAAV